VPGDDVSMPTLMSAAQRTYLVAIQEALAGAGFGDVPPTGYRIVGALTRGGSSVQELATRLAMSKQAVGRLADVLVQRGYVTRTSDAADRRRVILLLTERGGAATEEARQAIATVDQLVAGRVESHELATTRATLRALVSIGRGLRPGLGGGRGGDAS
jgi:DNA-binding MarR family transcriptional regulator